MAHASLAREVLALRRRGLMIDVLGRDVRHIGRDRAVGNNHVVNRRVAMRAAITPEEHARVARMTASETAQHIRDRLLLTEYTQIMEMEAALYAASESRLPSGRGYTPTEQQARLAKDGDARLFKSVFVDELDD